MSLSRKTCLAALIFTFQFLHGSDPVRAQDTRTVTEPAIPASCSVIAAYFPSKGDGVPASLDNASQSTSETLSIQSALNACPSGEAVELALQGVNNAFVVNPLTIPKGVSLLVDGGVIVFGTRDPSLYQAPAQSRLCGSTYSSVGGCVALITFEGDSSGLYGYGVIDGRAGSTMTSGPNAGVSWWDLIASAPAGTSANNPWIVYAPAANNLVLYKITLRNSPWYAVAWKGEGFTAWGIKIQGPWNIGDTDGIDLYGTNATVAYSTISNGDDQIAIDGQFSPAGHITIENFTGYGRDGITIGSSTEAGVSNILVQNSNLIADVASNVGTTVNNISEADMQSNYGLTSYLQALPTSTNKTVGLNIKTRADRGGSITNVTYSSICLKNLNYPIRVGNFNDPDGGSLYPTVQNIRYQDIHGLKHTGVNNSYQLVLEGYPPGQPQGNGIILDDVVFDDQSAGKSSIQTISARGNEFSTLNNVYPPQLNALSSAYVANPVATGVYPSVTVTANTYIARSAVTSSNSGLTCPADIFPPSSPASCSSDLELKLGIPRICKR